MKFNGAVIGLAIVAAAAFCTAGCGDNGSSSTDTSGSPEASPTIGAAEAAGKAVDQTGQNIKNSVNDVSKQTAAAATDATAKVEQGTKNAAAVVHNAGAVVGAAAVGTAQSVSNSTKKAVAPVVLTPKVKMALIADPNVDAAAINVDTNSNALEVILSGTVKSDAQRTEAVKTATTTLANAHSTYKVVDNIKVAK